MKNRKRVLFTRIMSIFVIIAVISAQLTIITPVVNAQESNENRTPFQQSLINTMAERNSKGLPVPSNVSYAYEIKPSVAAMASPNYLSSVSSDFTIKATTVIYFENPLQAGYEKWPDYIIQGEKPAGTQGYINPGDYSKYIKDKIAEKNPGIWEKYEFGYEPSTFTFNETYTVNSSNSSANTPAQTTNMSADIISSNKLLMGFTVAGPNIDYSFSWKKTEFGVDIVDFWAGYTLDWGFGLRLPMEYNLSGNSSVNEGSTFGLNSNVRGLNWSEEDYRQTGVLPAGGNEFLSYFNFKFRIYLDLVIFSPLETGFDINIDKSQSFVTPFGPGASFPIPYLDVPIWGDNFHNASWAFGFTMRPEVGSEKFTCDWTASEAASGNGSVIYTDTDPSVSKQVGPISAIDGPGYANININNFKYYFNKFLMHLGVYLDLHVLGYNPRIQSPTTTFDLSDILSGLALGVHPGTKTSISSSILVQNVPPSVGPITGVPSVPIQVNTPINVGASFTDPGINDTHTAIWKWDDGTTSPGIVSGTNTSGSVAGSHEYTSAGVYSISLDVTDKDGGTGSSTYQYPLVVYEPIGTLKIVKNTEGGDGTFTYAITGPSTVPNQNITTSGGTGSVSLLVPAGSYTVNEILPPGWVAEGPTSATVLVPINGGTGTATFKNKLLTTVKIKVSPGCETPPSLIDLAQPSFPIYVEIYGSEKFDVHDINFRTVTFEGAKTGPEIKYRDENADGIPDVMLYFRTGDTKIEPGQTIGTLNGMTNSGIAFSGTDIIRLK